MILACVILTQYQRVTDKQTDGRTDRHTDDSDNSACIACYANALLKPNVQLIIVINNNNISIIIIIVINIVGKATCDG